MGELPRFRQSLVMVLRMWSALPIPAVSSDPYVYLIADEDGNIITTATNAYDFEGAAVGIGRVYGLSYRGSLAVDDKNVSDSDLSSIEYSLSSNFIEVNRVAPPTITIESVDAEQAPNVATNMLDGNTVDESRWSARSFPKSVVFDLGASYQISGTKMWTYQDRAYQYRVETSNSPDTGFTLQSDQTENTSNAQPHATNFSTTARYVKLTVTGAHSYSGDWVSITEFEIEIGRTARTARTEVSPITKAPLVVYPNPSFTGFFRLSTDIDWQVYSTSGEVVLEGNGNEVDLSGLPRGTYFLKSADHKIQRLLFP